MMGTQGMVVVVRDGREVVLKAICGSDGYNAEHLANWLSHFGGDAPREEVYRKALELDFGGEGDLVVMDAEGEEFHGGEPLHPRYRETFHLPCFNPRWECGVTERFELVTAVSPFPPRVRRPPTVS